MTIRNTEYSLLSGEEVIVTFPSDIPPASKHTLRKHIGVIVKSASGEVLGGQIVSYLPLSDWAIANGYQILNTGKTYPAFQREVTRLS
jgi:hypothetical protein